MSTPTSIVPGNIARLRLIPEIFQMAVSNGMRAFRWFGFQLSLRAMFLAVMLVAVLCGILSNHLRKARYKQQVVNRLRETGGALSDPDYYKQYYQFGPTPVRPGFAWARQFTGEDAYINFDWVQLVGPDANDDVLLDVAYLETVEHINLYKCPVTDRGIRHLERLNLKSLELEDTNVSVEGAKYLSQRIPNCKIILTYPDGDEVGTSCSITNGVVRRPVPQ